MSGICEKCKCYPNITLNYRGLCEACEAWRKHYEEAEKIARGRDEEARREHAGD